MTGHIPRKLEIRFSPLRAASSPIDSGGLTLNAPLPHVCCLSTVYCWLSSLLKSRGKLLTARVSLVSHAVPW